MAQRQLRARRWAQLPCGLCDGRLGGGRLGGGGLGGGGLGGGGLGSGGLGCGGLGGDIQLLRGADST